MADLYQNTHNPDVLLCLANLSNDEVFTPPNIVNQMLDMLPQELFRDPSAKFLDPACKTGIFLREIAKGCWLDWKTSSPTCRSASTTSATNSSMESPSPKSPACCPAEVYTAPNTPTALSPSLNLTTQRGISAFGRHSTPGRTESAYSAAPPTCASGGRTGKDLRATRMS